MPDLYTDETAETAANFIPLGFTERDPYGDVDEAARAVLDAVAPAIAAKALRDFAEELLAPTPGFLADGATCRFFHGSAIAKAHLLDGAK